MLRVDLHCAAGVAPGFDFTDPLPLLAAMDENEIARAVLGPIGQWAAVDEERGDAALHDWCARWPDRFARWVTVNPWRPDAAARLARALTADVAGVKLLPGTQGFSLLHSALVDPVLAVAEQAECPVYVVTGVPVASEPFQLTELARRFPGLTFIMGRSGRTDFSLDLLPALQGVPNVIAETAYNSGAVIHEIVSALGVERMVFASDAPFNDIDLEIARVQRAGLDPEIEQSVFAGAARWLMVGGRR